MGAQSRRIRVLGAAGCDRRDRRTARDVTRHSGARRRREPRMTMAVEDKAIRFRGHFMVPLLAATPLDCFITEPKCPGRTSVVHKGRVAFGAMDEVVFG